MRLLAGAGNPPSVLSGRRWQPVYAGQSNTIERMLQLWTDPAPINNDLTIQGVRNGVAMNKQSIWYVYDLIDPRSMSVFYVGKGKGNRIEAHEKDAAKPDAACSKKINKIKDIWA
jgi:hypothetical protein